MNLAFPPVIAPVQGLPKKHVTTTSDVGVNHPPPLRFWLDQGDDKNCAKSDKSVWINFFLTMTQDEKREIELWHFGQRWQAAGFGGVCLLKENNGKDETGVTKASQVAPKRFVTTTCLWKTWAANRNFVVNRAIIQSEKSIAVFNNKCSSLLELTHQLQLPHLTQRINKKLPKKFFTKVTLEFKQIEFRLPKNRGVV